MTPDDIESIERATLSAVLPEALEEIPGWLLPFDPGTVGRASSAVPISHNVAADAALLHLIEERYAARSLPTVLRLASVAPLREFCDLLSGSGYAGEKLTQVHTAATSVVSHGSDHGAIEIATAPDDGWAAVFLGEGFDPVDGASRVKTLSRGTGTLFASVREDGRTVAAGALAFGYGWASVHGMRTALACRGKGLGRLVLAGLAHAALAQGYGRMFLQVEANNESARSLYRRAGFQPAWNYAYWRKRGAAAAGAEPLR